MHWIILIMEVFYIWLNILFSDYIQTAFYYAFRNENENIANLLLEYTKVRKEVGIQLHANWNVPI